MMYSEVLNFDGASILMFGGWRFRRNTVSDINSGLDTLAIVNEDLNASPIDSTNGLVILQDRSSDSPAQNNSTSSTVISTAEIAAAVWSYIHSNGNTAESNMVSSVVAVQNAFALSI